MEFESYDTDEGQVSEFFSRDINKLHLLLILALPFYIFFGGSTLYGYGAFLGILVFFLRRDIKFKEIFVRENKMTVPLFFIFLILTQMLSLDAYIFGNIAENALNAAGLSAGVTIRENLLYYEYQPRPFYEVLSVGFLAPFMEEMIFRGYIAGAYRQYSGSKIFSILFTAICFGVSHCSPHTSVPIVFNAIILGYIAMEYGIIWTMIYHSAINFLSAYVVYDVLIMKLPVEIRERTALLIFIPIAVCGLVIVLIKRKAIVEYIRENLFDREHLKLTLRSITFIIYMAVLFFITISRIEKFDGSF